MFPNSTEDEKVIDMYFIQPNMQNLMSWNN